MAKQNKKGPKGNVFKVAGAKSLKKSKAKAVNLGLKNGSLQTVAPLQPIVATKYRRKLGQPIKYKRKPGSRRYVDYTQKQLEECLAAIRSKKFTQRDAAEYFNIPRSTIKNKLAKRNCSKPGRQPIFSEEEEKMFVKRIATLSEYGIPLSNLDLKMVIKDYLTSQNKTVTIFKNNLPGKDWLKYFFDRHQELCDSLESKIARSRTELSEKTISEFIDNVYFKTIVPHVPPQNIYSYCEISFRDDPKKKTIVCKRGVKYPDTTAIETAKAKFSVMFCANAVGETVPPYITYKSEPGCSTWTENGPKGAHYNCTKSGWMNCITFENWFRIHLLPALRKKRGRKVLICENVSSHINGNVLTLCQKYDIRFICLPHKSSHILHPLHYAYFQPLRLIWVQLLLDWQSSQIAKRLSTQINKDFPFLLRKALNALTDTTQNIIVGFEKTGIFPINKDEPLYRLPTAHKNIIDNHMLKYTDYKFGYLDADPFDSQDDSECTEIIPKEEFENSISGMDVLEDNLGALDVVDGDLYIIVVQGDEVLQIPLQVNEAPIQEDPFNVAIGDHVIVTHGTSNYPGKILSISAEGASVHRMKKWKSLWRWPSIMREQLYSWEEIVCKIQEPRLVRRGCFFIPEIDCN